MGRTSGYVIIFGMDNLPSGPIQTAEALQRRQRLQMKAALELFEAGDMYTLAEQLSKGDPAKAKKWRTRLRLWIQEPYFQELVGTFGKGELMLAIPGTTMAVSRRARKGNVPAGKLAFEASGFHNPRVQHEHSGDIKITITEAPRPEPVVDVIDAEEVEE